MAHMRSPGAQPQALFFFAGAAAAGAAEAPSGLLVAAAGFVVFLPLPDVRLVLVVGALTSGAALPSSAVPVAGGAAAASAGGLGVFSCVATGASATRSWVAVETAAPSGVVLALGLRIKVRATATIPTATTESRT